MQPLNSKDIIQMVWLVCTYQERDFVLAIERLRCVNPVDDDVQAEDAPVVQRECQS